MGKPQKSKGKGRNAGKTLYRYQPTLPNGRRTTINLGAIRESVANSVCRNIDDLIGAAKNNIQPDATTKGWLLGVDQPLLDKLDRLGLCDGVRDIIDLRLQHQNPETPNIPTLATFRDWYRRQRKSDCEESTVRKQQAALNNLIHYCNEFESVDTIADISREMAFRFQLHRNKTRSPATVSKDVKICKTAFKYANEFGWLQTNPFLHLRAGAEVNPEGHHILSIVDYDVLIDWCPNSTWRAVIALARIGGLRIPSELISLKWTHVNWADGRILITSPKTKRYGRLQRTIPLFGRLEKVLSEHYELTGSKNEFVIDNPAYRHRDANLRTKFHRIREKAGIARFPNPFRNLRLSAANDISRAGYSMKVVVEWFGHDIATALKHYHLVVPADYERARQTDPFEPEYLTQNPTQALP